MRLFPFGSDREEDHAEELLAGLTRASRRPGFFVPGRIPDTLNGRFELLTLHAVLALRRLQRVKEEARFTQLFTDLLFRHLDAGLREAGVGDLSVPKRMHKLAGDFYGRLGAYDRALAEGRAALEAALTRNALAGAADFAGPLADYVEKAVARLDAAPVQGLLSRDAWPEPPQ